jgi:predicted DNA-binding transcriptional regulator AlpA
MVDVAIDALTSGEVGRLLGVSRQRVNQLRSAYVDFPKPVDEIGGRPVWRRVDVLRWARAHDRPVEGAAG